MQLKKMLSFPVPMESRGVPKSAGAAATGAPIYSNVFEEEEHKPIPFVQFGEFINRIKRGNYVRLKQEYTVRFESGIPKAVAVSF